MISSQKSLSDITFIKSIFFIDITVSHGDKKVAEVIHKSSHTFSPRDFSLSLLFGVFLPHSAKNREAGAVYNFLVLLPLSFYAKTTR